MFGDQSPQRPPDSALPWRKHHGLVVLCSMGALAFVLLALSVVGDQGIFRIRQLNRDRELLESKVSQVESDNAELRHQLAQMKQGRASFELAAREKLGLVRPGEVVYDFRADPLSPR